MKFRFITISIVGLLLLGCEQNQLDKKEKFMAQATEAGVGEVARVHDREGSFDWSTIDQEYWDKYIEISINSKAKNTERWQAFLRRKNESIDFRKELYVVKDVNEYCSVLEKYNRLHGIDCKEAYPKFRQEQVLCKDDHEKFIQNGLYLDEDVEFDLEQYIKNTQPAGTRSND